MKTENIRACLLEKGDKFIIGSKIYKVTKMDESSIYYRPVSGGLRGGQAHYFGRDSREFIQLIDEGKNKIHKVDQNLETEESEAVCVPNPEGKCQETRQVL